MHAPIPLPKNLPTISAQTLIAWATQTFKQGLIMTSSFGADSAVMLHMVTKITPNIPIVLIDTGYLFPETYIFIETLKKQLHLNIKIYRSPQSPSEMEKQYGKLWEQGEAGIAQYHEMRKVEPMNRALKELDVTAWIAGLRADQNTHRSTLPRIEIKNGIYKIYPLLHWSADDIDKYLILNDLPKHPLVKKGYASIGDTHSTFPAKDRSGRKLGEKSECRLHI